MTNAIFDLSNMFFRSMFIVGGYGAKNYSFDSQFEVDQLMRKVSTDVSYIIRQINPSRVLFALDSKSWRKEISIDENDGYKANREKSGIINWDNVFNTMREFGEILESNGFIVTKLERAEADDIMALWRDELLFNQHQHVILVSADEDVRQLIKSHEYETGKRVFSTVFNPFATGKGASKKLYIPEHFNEWIQKQDIGDIFNRAIDVDKQDFIRLRDTEKITVEEVNGNAVALKKIFCGDDGDNVPAIYSWLNDKGKTVRITNVKSEKIINFIGAKDHRDLIQKAPIIYDQLTEISGQTPSFRNMLDRLNRQIKLVVLARDVFPEEIVQAFDNKLQEQLGRPNVHPQDWNMNSILEGTKYVKAKSGNEASIFKEIDRINTLF
jgi:hypothetical protein